MLQLGLYWVLYHLFLWHALFLFRYAEIRLTAAGSHAVISMQELYGRFTRDYSPVVVCALITLPIVVLDMMKLTHRVAGPIVRFQNTLRDLTAGKHVPSLQLRKGDLLTEFQDEFNKYLAHLSRQRRSAFAPVDEEQVAREVGDLCRDVHAAANRPSQGAETSHTQIS
ncbi:MAG: hypothetical protein AB7Q45_17050 [Planctomycetaceae bacterium]